MRIIANTSTSNRISNVYQHFFLFSTSSSPILLIHCFFNHFFFPKPSFLVCIFSLLSRFLHTTCFFAARLIFFRMEVFTFFVLGLGQKQAIHWRYFRLARELSAFFKSQFIGNFQSCEDFLSSANRRIACTRLGNPKICFTLHQTRRHFPILGQRKSFYLPR